MTIAVFNVKFSPNLGDGLLAECLEGELRAVLPGVAIVAIDLAGRRGYGEGTRGRRIMLMMLERSPAWLRRTASRLALGRLTKRRLRPAWRDALARCDAVVVGGGNLFADADLNFPMKIAAALDEAAARKLPVAVFGVGATRNWSDRGRRLFGAALAGSRLIDASVRDDRSRRIWNDMLGAWQVRGAVIARDPGMLACRHFPAAPASREHRTIGICITDPVALRYHATGALVTRELDRWYGDCVAALAEAGYRVTLFTNGSPEDRSYLARRGAAWIARAGHRATIAPAFATPGALATFASGCDLLIAHRMHACIAAWSFRVPSIGLVWDTKLDSFFQLIGREAFLIDPAAVPPSEVTRLAARAIALGIDPVVHAAHLERAAEDVARLATLLAEAVAGRTAA